MTLTLSSPEMSNGYTSVSARVPECQKIKKGGLDQYGAERLGRFIFATIRKRVELKGLNDC